MTRFSDSNSNFPSHGGFAPLGALAGSFISAKRDFLIAAIVVAALVALFPTRSYASAPEIYVEVNIDKSDITVGDLFLFTISVRHEPRVKVNIPSVADKLGEFMIRDIRAPEREIDGEMAVDEVTYQLTTYFTGEISVPAVTIKYEYTDEKGKKKTETIDSEPIKINVKSVSPEKATDIKDIKGPVSVPVNWRYYAFWGGIVFGVVALAAIAILYWTRWRKEAVEKALETPPRPAHETAFDRLKAIEEMDLIAQGRFNEYYEEVTQTLRAYLGARYTMDALEMTTSEIIDNLQPSLKDLEIKRKVGAVLEDGDMVKFAKHIPPSERAKKALHYSRDIVTGTLPAMFLKGQGGLFVEGEEEARRD